MKMAIWAIETLADEVGRGFQRRVPLSGSAQVGLVKKQPCYLCVRVGRIAT